MYELLYAPIEGDSTDIALDWAALDCFPCILKACEQLAKEIEKDIAHGDVFAYRIVPEGEWR